MPMFAQAQKCRYRAPASSRLRVIASPSEDSRCWTACAAGRHRARCRAPRRQAASSWPQPGLIWNRPRAVRHSSPLCSLAQSCATLRASRGLAMMTGHRSRRYRRDIAACASAAESGPKPHRTMGQPKASLRPRRDIAPSPTVTSPRYRGLRRVAPRSRWERPLRAWQMPCSTEFSVLAVARARSFTRAAAALHLSQPALSRRVAALEAELASTLVQRGRAGAALTEAGRHVLDFVEAQQSLDEDRTPTAAACASPAYRCWYRRSPCRRWRRSWASTRRCRSRSSANSSAAPSRRWPPAASTRLLRRRPFAGPRPPRRGPGHL